MALLTVIGRGVRVRGRIQGEGDLAVEGYVEGEISVTGELIVEAAGLLGGNSNARVIVVRGAVRGDLTAEEVVRLEEGARVVGDLRAPRIAIAKGALVRGLVQTGAADAAPRPAAKKEVRSAPKPAPTAAPRAPAKAATAPPPPARPAPKPAEAPRAEARTAARPAPPSMLAGGSPSKGPPPPVVPALKKGAKAALKKKAT
jgi:cytoskeletal protein CcmA (bactofilin family)